MEQSPYHGRKRIEEIGFDECSICECMGQRVREVNIGWRANILLAVGAIPDCNQQQKERGGCAPHA